MNKTLMLVICDFLLLSMLALARFDPPEETPEVALDATASSATSEEELIRLLEESLQMEQSSRTTISEDLDQTRSDLEAKARELSEREAALEATRLSLEVKSTEADELAKTKTALESEKAQLAQQAADLDAQRLELSQKFEATRTELEGVHKERVELNRTLGTLQTESSVTKERLTQTEEKLLARELALAEREAALQAAQAEANRLADEQAQLAKELEVAQTERRMLQTNLAQTEREKALLQEEKQQAYARAEALGRNVSELGQNVSALGADVSELGTGVTELTATSAEIQKEIIDSRPQTMSEIFTRFQNNRATITFNAIERNFLGVQSQKQYVTKSNLIIDSSGTHYLVTHSSDTPFGFNRSIDVLSASVSVEVGSQKLTVSQIGFLATDPRIVFIPLPKSVVTNSGMEVFELAQQPERWEEAVLIKNDESNFGRTEFRRLTSSASFLRMERPVLGQLLADFASTRGDLAFTKNARFIGVLTDNKHTVVINDVLASGVLNLGNQYQLNECKALLDRLEARVLKLPKEVQ
ncbi:hypothetical protein [Coraliomargarita akajimensis]|uniref:Chromosome segregation ATPase-like protein n=1 Tax=Coraliomargarita akajimensis (strain DSM 45221 / IAM 15411 / JCM 23193 / KCTC 12865 / 04OKA010-24) TaxID=583355 RepID=D5EQT6_CORAD|nr:hypothetical protein [Coraliomargarita akajimensis]ADE53929.1 Chromosome segregation ATPase-like protein [Coraliomargarita akajimensis DSM 45221]